MLERIATPRSAALARVIADRGERLVATAAAALDALRAEDDSLKDRQRDVLRRAIGMRLPMPKLVAPIPAAVELYAIDRRALESLCREYDSVLRAELDAAAGALDEFARRDLPAYAVFASSAVEGLAFDKPANAGPSQWDRQRDRHLLLYLQRLSTKNETFSAFGPSGWGRIERGIPGAMLKPAERLKRHAYLERWVAASVVAAMNRDPATREELAPRLHPHGRLDGFAFLRLDTGERIAVSAEDLALLRQCDGRTPAHLIAPESRLEVLERAGVLRWEAECPALVVDRIAVLRGEVQRWREVARKRWLPLLDELAALPVAFAEEHRPSGRRELMGRARALLGGLAGPNPPPTKRMLYRASNPIGEECARDCEFLLGQRAADDLAARVSPWFELWQDTVNFAAHRANEKLRGLHSAVGRGSAQVPLSALVAASERAGLSLAHNGVPTLAHLAFLEIGAAFRSEVEHRPDAREWVLSTDDCAFVRRRFDFPRFDAFTCPSADLQIAASSLDEVASGRCQWVVAELHAAVAVLQHGIYWACPDPAGFGASVREVAEGVLCDWGFLGAELSTHTLVHYEALGDLWSYAGAGRVPPEWAHETSSDTVVYVTDDGDVRIRADGRDCGSFARSWVLPLGFHPFVLSRAPHTPRLVVNGVIVQRESWVITAADLPRTPRLYGSAHLAVEADRLRTSKGMPRFVYVRPTMAAVQRLGAAGRDKDVKPVFLDLESYPFLEILARWRAKYDELEFTEMLPAPSELAWVDAQGHRTFELRTLFKRRRPLRGAPFPSSPR